MSKGPLGVQLEVLFDGTPLGEAALRALSLIRIERPWNAPARAALRFRALAPNDHQALASHPRDAALEIRVDGAGLFVGLLTGRRERQAAGRAPDAELYGCDRLLPLARAAAPWALEGARFSDLLARCLPTLSIDAHADSRAFVQVLKLAGDDLAHLQRLAARSGLGFQLEGSAIQLFDAAGYGAPIELTPGRDLISWEVERDDERPYGHAVADGWLLGEGHRMLDFAGEEADSPGELFLQAPGEDAESMTARGQAALAERHAERLVVRLEAFGRADLCPGRRITCTGLGAAADDPVLVRAVEHHFSAEAGWITRATSALPVEGRARPAATTAQVGTVEDLVDPEHRGRLRVRLAGDVVTSWLPTVSPFAGAHAGLVALPARGDTVLVIFIDADLGRGLVAGALWAEGAFPHDLAPSADQFHLLTRGGHRLRFDDAAHRIELVTAAGSRLELGPDSTRLHSKKPLTIEAPGQRLTLRAERIDFEQA